MTAPMSRRGLMARRAWRSYAAARRLAETRSIRTVDRDLARPRGQSIDDWNLESSRRHDHYRADHDPCVNTASVVCVTRRPHRLDDVIENVRRQEQVDVELIVVANGDGFDLDRAQQSLADLDGAALIAPETPLSLGGGLNRGLARAQERFVAKFDDDDHYGPNFLADSLRAHGFARAGVVGKHSYYADVAELDARFLRFPGHEFTYGSTLAGGTLVIDRQRTGDIRFPDVSLGEDGAFIAACHRAGISTFSCDRFNFVQHRGADNTWRPPAGQFVQGALEVDPRAPAHMVDR